MLIFSSGKTLAFGLPALASLFSKSKSGKKNQPKILVLAPTRELALQTHEIFNGSSRISSVCVFGGVQKSQQRRELQSADVVVATPGRLIDFCEEEGACDLSKVEYFVLDEADRMLDFGFEPAIRKIVSKIPACDKRQTLMFSATWPESVRKLASDFMRKDSDVIRVTIGSPDLAASSNVTQIVEVMQDPQGKDNRLCALLNQYHKSRKNRVLIFALYKKEAVRIESMLMKRGWNVQVLGKTKIRLFMVTRVKTLG